MKVAFLGMGSNVGDREANLRDAIARFTAAGMNVLRCSPVYETEPVDYTAQRWFLNQVVEVETSLFPVQLLARTSRIEREMGRVRTVAKGPRTIDIDILLYGNTVMRGETLEIPHPRMHERRFVLAPLAELAPDLVHPALHRTIRQLLDAAAPATVRRLA